LTIFGLRKDNVVARATAAATGYVSVMSYFRYGERRGDLSGNLARLMQHLAERGKVKYSRVDLVAYSFGTIVALDALFPPRGQSVRTFSDIGRLVTIGCPFDF